jgi:Ca2+/H+ antiporter
MGAGSDPLLTFLQLCWQVIQVITAIVLLIYAYFLVRYARAHDALLRRRFGKEQAPPASSESKQASMASLQVAKQEQQLPPQE